MYKYILFDLDGTLTDSREGVTKSVRYALEKLGRPVPSDDVLTQFVGPPLQESFPEYGGVTEAEEIRQAIAFFRERYDTVGKFENAAGGGVPEMLAELKAAGYVLALASSKPEDMCRVICERYGLAPYLDVIAGSQPGADWQKASVIRLAMERMGLAEADKASLLMVGDRKYDVLGAAEVGVDCLGVEFFGYALPGELMGAGAVAVVDTPAELLAWIREQK